VLYRSNLPNYGEVCQALEGDVTVLMWQTAASAFDRTLIWGASIGETPVVTSQTVIEGFRSWRADRVTLGAFLAGLGLVCILFGVVRWSQTPREGPTAR